MARVTLRRISCLVLLMSFLVGFQRPLLSGGHDSAADRTVTIAATPTPDLGAAVAIDSALANVAKLGTTWMEQRYGVSGKGQLIAIVDSGIDPVMPGFRSAGGVNRIVGWYDVTDEGMGQTIGKYTAAKDQIHLGDDVLTVKGLVSQSGTFLVGRLPPVLRNSLGKPAPSYYVVCDPHVKGVYQAVVVDTNQDFDFQNETVLYSYDTNPTATSFHLTTDKSVGLVVTGIENNGALVRFGFDLNGHGTSLAYLSASGGPGNYRGVATGSQLIAIKAITFTGDGSWQKVLEAVKHALALDVDVVLVGAVPHEYSEDREWRDVLLQARCKGINVVMPVGNSGPGLGTVTVDKPYDSLLVVGGFIHPSALVSSKTLTEDVIYPWSSIGPDPNGNLGIDLVSPALSSVPTCGHSSEVRFSSIDGTSVSAAYAAGALAVLRQAANVNSPDPKGNEVLAALVGGAQVIPNSFPVEQGNGRVDLPGAWRCYQQHGFDDSLQLARKWEGTVTRNGLWVKGTGLGILPIWIDNFGPFSRNVTFSTSTPWLQVQAKDAALRGAGQYETWVRGTPGLSPGFYCGNVVADDPDTPNIDASLCVSASIPHCFYDLGTSPKDRIRFQAVVDKGNPIVRHFIEVPASVEGLNLSFGPTRQGVLWALYNPDSLLVAEGVCDGQPVFVGLPTSGLWQIVVYGDVLNNSITMTSVPVEARLQGFAAIDAGSNLSSHTYLMTSQSSEKVQYVLTAGSFDAEWRYRKSGNLTVNSASTVAIPKIQEKLGGICVRFGTVSQNKLKIFLYHYKDNQSKWVEVASAETLSSGLGNLYYPEPEKGDYMVFMEASGPRPRIYSEMDIVLVPSKGNVLLAPTSKGTSLPTAVGSDRFATCSLTPRYSTDAPKYVLIQSQSGRGVVGVVERALMVPQNIPLIQIQGGSEVGKPAVRTIRASTSDGRYGLDVVVNVGGASYQLDKGRATVWINDVDVVSYNLPGSGIRYCVEATP